MNANRFTMEILLPRRESFINMRTHRTDFGTRADFPHDATAFWFGSATHETNAASARQVGNRIAGRVTRPPAKPSFCFADAHAAAVLSCILKLKLELV
jgi:hypothetical protein